MKRKDRTFYLVKRFGNPYDYFEVFTTKASAMHRAKSRGLIIHVREVQPKGKKR